MASACAGVERVGQGDIVLGQKGGQHLVHLRIVLDQQDL